MKHILYIGNKLNSTKTNATSIEVLGRLLENEKYTITYSSSYQNKFVRFFDMIFSVIKSRSKVDVVLIDTYSTQNFYYALVVSQLCRFFKLKYIPILHGGNLPNRLKNNPKLSRLIFSKSYTNVSPSLYLKKAFEDFGYSNTTYIPNAIEIEKYSFNNRSIQAPKILWVRSFNEIYNPQMAIRVLKNLKNDEIDASLCMVGPDGGLLKEVKQLAEQLQVNVKFTGKLTKAEWINLSKDYNVFINTTNFDNMPISVIEAMALGLPVVSTNVGGIPFLIKHEKQGVLVEQNNEQEMANAIKYLIDNKSKTEDIVKSARQNVEQFSWNNVKQLWFDVL